MIQPYCWVVNHDHEVREQRKYMINKGNSDTKDIVTMLRVFNTVLFDDITESVVYWYEQK